MTNWCCQDSLVKSERNRHVHNCIHADIARSQTIPLQKVHYCYLCFAWVLGDSDWERHCGDHISSMTSKRRGSITYCHTLVRPAYSPFRLSKGSSAATKLTSWTRDRKLWEEDIRAHMSVCQWPMQCPDPLCDSELEDEKKLYFHFLDVHKMGNGSQSGKDRSGKTVSQDTLTPSRKRKWKYSSDNSGGWDDGIQSPVPAIATPTTVSPQALLLPEQGQTDTNNLCATLGDRVMEEPFSIPLQSDNRLQPELYPENANLPTDPLIDFSEFIRSPSPLDPCAVDDSGVDVGDQESTPALSMPPSPPVCVDTVDKEQCEPAQPRVRLRLKPPQRKEPKVILRLKLPKRGRPRKSRAGSS